MTLSSGRLIGELIEVTPEFRELYEEHLRDNYGEVLPHVLFWEFTQAIVASYLTNGESWKAALGIIEGAFGSGDDYTDGVISASFLESLPCRGEPGAEIVDFLGPNTHHRLTVIKNRRPDAR
ncbi:MAG TPA: hypothetical protein VIL16_34035 [Trebonia sp.]|jgi:hypothetical protein